MARPYDLILYGATGFTGRRMAWALKGLSLPYSWAIAGRDPVRLKALAAELGVPWHVADAQDKPALADLAKQARVITSTAGPFALYSDNLVQACAAEGTHWCDLTGETAWVRRLIDRHHDEAVRRGTRIVPLCGFDSIPSDTAVDRLTREAQQRWGEDLARVDVRWRLRGGLNGGTMASARAIGESGDWRVMGDAGILTPHESLDKEQRTRLRDANRPWRDQSSNHWLVPFIMGPVDVRVVRRTRSLLGLDPLAILQREGQDLGGGWLRASMATLMLGVFGALLLSRPGRFIVRMITPAPGKGPSEESIQNGRTRATFDAETTGGKRLVLELDAKGDAGNLVTVRCLLEATLMLLEDAGPGEGGVMTPVAAFGPELLDRLIATGEYQVRVSVPNMG
jgi:short subunit dehydrogenase-like uncharacterized protein